jgi:predicted phosphoribosyltransferase
MYGRYGNRAEAGRALASALGKYAGRSDLVVIGLPRGGVPVAYEVAQALGAPLDVFIVRKLGTPGQEELAMGAIATGGVRVLNQEVISALGIDRLEVNAVASRELAEITRREELYRGGRPRPDLRGRTVIVVDDGLATGSTMRAAVQALRQHAPREIVVAVPVGSVEACELLEQEADKLVCLVRPEFFLAVGAWFEDFTQTTDQEVKELLDRAEAQQQPAPGP